MCLVRSVLPLTVCRYNPTGVYLPPPQAKLEADYKRVLKEKYEIDFNSLFCITNIPINRFLDNLVEKGKLDEYMQLLVNGGCPVTAGVIWSDDIFQRSTPLPARG